MQPIMTRMYEEMAKQAQASQEANKDNNTDGDDVEVVDAEIEE